MTYFSASIRHGNHGQIPAIELTTTQGHHQRMHATLPAALASHYFAPDELAIMDDTQCRASHFSARHAFGRTSCDADDICRSLALLPLASTPEQRAHARSRRRFAALMLLLDRCAKAICAISTSCAK